MKAPQHHTDPTHEAQFGTAVDPQSETAVDPLVNATAEFVYFRPMKAQLVAPLPIELLTPRRLSIGSLLFYARINLYRSGGKGAWPKYETLAKELGANKSSAKRWAAELRRAGLLEWETRNNPRTKRRTSNLYQITKKAEKIEARAQRPLWIPVSVLGRRDLPLGAKFLYALLLRKAGKELSARASVSTLVKRFRLAERSVRRWLGQLVDRGLCHELSKDGAEVLYGFPYWNGMEPHLLSDLDLYTRGTAVLGARQNGSWPPAKSNQGAAEMGPKEVPYKTLPSKEFPVKESRVTLSGAHQLAPEKEQRASANLNKTHTDERNQSSAQVLSRPRSSTNSPVLRRLEGRWFELCKQHGHAAQRAMQFSPKERKHVAELLHLYDDVERVELSFLYILRCWTTIRGRFFTKNPMIPPTVSLLRQLHDTLFPEAHAWRTTWTPIQRHNITPWEAVFETDDDDYMKALNVLSSLDLDEFSVPASDKFQ